MSEQNKRASTSTLADPPVKRKRGRPRKDENLVQKEKAQSPQIPPPDGVRNNQCAKVDPGDDIEDGMVGQVVSGVIEGSFDAGYFLSVRAGSSNTLLRGVVFQPGQLTPITAANDVAPHAKMYKRREFPIPVFNPQGQVNGSIPQSEENNEPVQLENQAPMVPIQVLPPEVQTGSPFALANQCAENMPQQNSNSGIEKESALKLQSGAPFALANQSASVEAPLTDTLLQNDPGAALGGKYLPQEVSELGLDNQSTSQLQSGSPFPLPNQSAFGKVPVTDSLPKNNSELGPENQCAHQLQSGIPFAHVTQSASVTMPLTSKLPEKNSGASLGGKHFPLQNSESGEKPSIPQLPSATPFPLAGGYASMTVPLTDSLPKNNSSASMGGKDMPQQNSKSALDSQPKLQMQSCASFGEKDMPQKNFESSLHNQPIPHLQMATPFALVNQPASVMAPLTDTLPKNDSGASLGGRNMPQQISEFGLEKLSTPQFENDRITGQDEIMQDIEASPLLERPKIDVKGTKVVIPEVASELTFDIFRGKENVNQVPQVQHQAVDSGLESSELAQNELKSTNLELHQTLVDDIPKSVPPEMPIYPKNDAPDIMQTVSTKYPGRDEITHNGKPDSDAADKDGVSQSAPKANNPEKIMEEAIPSEPEQTNTGGGFQSFLPKTNQPVTFVEEKAASPEPEVAAAGGTLLSGKGIPSL